MKSSGRLWPRPVSYTHLDVYKRQLYYLRRRGFAFPFHRSHIRLDRPSALRILRVGTPLALQDFLVNVSFLVKMCIRDRDLNFPSLLSNVIARMPMDGVLVLAMVPGILCGIGLNFGVSIGIIAGLLGMTISMEMGATGLVGFAVAILISTVFSSLFGYGYGAALNLSLIHI